MMLDLRDLTKSFGETPAVSGVTLAMDRGEFLCLLGPSGCGKSTLLRLVAGLIAPDRGRIAIDGADMTALPANRRPTAMVFQSHALWSHMTVARNVAFGLRVRGLPRAEIAAKVAASLDLVGLQGFERRRPSQLSGGQAQRVALARSLVVEPRLLLMDEPFSALDAHLRKNLRDELKSLQRRLGLTVIFVTHDQDEAMELADRIAVIDRGRLVQVGAPDALYLSPRTLTVARFIGQMNEGEALVEGGQADWYGVPVRLRLPDGPVTLMARPEDLRIVAAGGIEATVTRVVDLGPSLRLHLRTRDGAQLLWVLPRAGAPREGASVRVTPTRLGAYRVGERVGEWTAGAAVPDRSGVRA
jgi:putative spermidine/putrescine transport system ATP-binding protein